ncbi:MAG: Transcription antitermination protein RfaH [Bacteroidetes bacterium ADurb.Bin408]|nr:MAG: Transcription antitermination protein RfaH [Bacteroidetes bacterium ADurb.Bin408]
MLKKYVYFPNIYTVFYCIFAFLKKIMSDKQVKKNWFVVYTKPRHEKKSAALLQASGVEVYLPLRKELRSWSDRKKWVEMPLFPSYLFVNILHEDFKKVAGSYGIVKFIYSEGKPALIREEEIFAIKKIAEMPSNIAIEVSDDTLNMGDEVLVRKGPLAGLKVKLIEFKGKSRIAVEISNLAKTVLVEMDKSYLS